MDILYYWKDVEQDILTNKIGWLRSEQGVLAELAATPADNLWLVKTPLGHKGELELLGRVCLVDKPVRPVPKQDAASVVYYGACTEFCVNRHLAGNCHLVWRHNELEKSQRT